MPKHNEETRNKMSKSHKGKHHSEETKERIREGLLAYWRDRRTIEAAMKRAGFEVSTYKHSEETKEKMRQAAKGRTLSPDAKEALQKYQEERKQNTQLKQQLDNEQKGIH